MRRGRAAPDSRSRGRRPMASRPRDQLRAHAPRRAAGARAAAARSSPGPQSQRNIHGVGCGGTKAVGTISSAQLLACGGSADHHFGAKGPPAGFRPRAAAARPLWVVSSAEAPHDVRIDLPAASTEALDRDVHAPDRLTSNPLAASRVPTRVLPMSWMSPRRCEAPRPMTTRLVAMPSPDRCGRITAMAAFMAVAAVTSSGRKNSPSANRSPALRMPGTKPFSTICSGSIPAIQPLLCELGAQVIIPVEHRLVHLLEQLAVRVPMPHT